ncbi:MAG TPA: DUF2127 domain-containing protein [Opitutaceae bacterium]|nr:DUF2127 domain-containing protein [Opitutaceae bacterium]
MQPSEPISRKEAAWLRLIAGVKIAKGLLLVGIGLGALHLINRDLGEVVRNLAVNLRIDPENREVQVLLEKVADLRPHALRNFSLISFLFAADLFAEGIGLWLNKAWAKYLLVLATGFFLPFEVRGCIRLFSWHRLALLLANLAVFAYVVRLIWVHRRERRAR